MTVSADLDRRFREAAAAARLLDAGFDVVDSPLGPLLVATTDRGLLRVQYDADPEEQLERLARLAGPRVLRSPAAIDDVRGQLDQYFAGRRERFDLELDLRGVAPFAGQVLAELGGVPYGTTTTYGALAARAGAPKAARAVGNVMNRNPVPIVLPCHRVVGASGALTGYGGGLDRKVQLLRLEGVLA